MTVEISAFGVESDPLTISTYEGSKPFWSYIIVHHTGAEEKNTEQIRQYHKSLGWRDIGYHFVIERDGKVVNGRSLSLPGAHCSVSGMNFKGIGVALIGNFMNHPPTPAQVTALKQHITKLRSIYGISQDHVLGHGQVPGASTDCPGRLFPYDVLRPIRLFVNGRERDVPLRIVDGHSQILIGDLWIPVVPVVDAFGGSTTWVDEKRIIDVKI